MESLDRLLQDAEVAHGHLCAGQVLGVRMAMLGCSLLGIDDPRGPQSPDRKRLVTFVEIDRCATDAIAVVTGCRLGKRALKFRDWGKMAASFVDLGRPARPDLGLPSPIEGGRAVRIAARESSKDRARELFPGIENKNAQQMLAYREMPDDVLFAWQWVSIPLHPREMPGYKAGRILCAQCGEGINFDRHLERDGQILCQSCAHPESRYYQPL
jgi:formylmethanofuran dehydrogenase subunit E